MRLTLIILSAVLALSLCSQQKISDRTMNDRQQIIELYNHMYQAMVEKDTATLNSIHANEFVLIHMTGMRQSKHEYINAIADGTLNYYSAEHEQMDVAIDGDRATLTGRSRVTAAVFGGGKHTWQLQLTFQLVKRDGQWSFTSSQASTY
jgi:uncharacterized protein (TIGR02246 family)